MAVKRKRAVKKAPVKRRRRTTTLSAKKRPVRRIKRKSKGMLSELFNPAMAKGGATTVLSGALGGAAYGLMTKMLPDLTVTKKLAFGGVGSFILATVLQKPNLAAGLIGATVFDAMKMQGFLAESDDMQMYKYANAVKQLPMVLDENGNELMLSAGDNMYLSENIMNLAENTDYNVGYQGMPFGGE
jgi:hypothetical protein